MSFVKARIIKKTEMLVGFVFLNILSKKKKKVCETSVWKVVCVIFDIFLDETLPAGGALCGEKTITVFPIVVVKSRKP